MAVEWGFYGPGILLDSVDTVLMNICHRGATEESTDTMTDGWQGINM